VRVDGNKDFDIHFDDTFLKVVPQGEFHHEELLNDQTFNVTHTKV
jgi:hypothetical protein